MEFHISSKIRKKYQFEDSLFAFNGNVIFANFHAARVFAQHINEKRDLITQPALTVYAGQVNALGLIDEILHYVISQYRTQKMPRLYKDMETLLVKQLGKRSLNALLRAFTREFPPTPVFKGIQSVDEYLEDETDGIPNRLASLEELLILWITNQNPACQIYQELFADHDLVAKTSYSKMVKVLQEFFTTQPTFGPDNQNLVDMLRSPAIAVPASLRGQLDYIRSRWGDLLGHYLLKLLGSLNLFSEEEQLRGLGPGPVRIPVYGKGTLGELEAEHFSPDAHWMPNLVLIAKNTYVWLDQLSRRYGRSITHLDHIPDEELDTLADWGFTGLWLIGLWERSRASARIKQACGNPEAIASAYSLKDYHIADDLGGERALQDLRARCQQRGIRLASDMVPNHMAIDSNWVIEHPDWFISLPFSPFPSYTFNGSNLSDDVRSEIFIEDHYYDRSDAAVVFKYHDNHTNRTSYIYHGNDGTSMPWNDTAQLNYLDPNVREAIIRTILDVAHRFPIIRFDAAMTLARRHYQHLWFPLPGGGCDIPSRSDFSLPQDIFDQYMPEEFWREVVDRVAAEAPDTLLLAEAFWLMEGYFVRTLGMHRVYNSAFMNLLRDEDNDKYRQVMKNTLEFDPQILKRYVNFMNNPDEETAATQFGKDNKYFGICTLMSTMPGLPMFGHGQVEGLTEKYGMEYKHAYWDEQPDQSLVQRHEWQIFPFLKKRYLFAGVDNFYLYDFYDGQGMVDENVFAYSNRVGQERALIVYHNRFGDTAGWIHTSVTFMDKNRGILRQVDFRNGMDLPDGMHTFILFCDSLSGLFYIRNCHEVAQHGLYVQLDAYRAHVFMDFQIVEDDEQCTWQQVHDTLNGRGTADIQALHWELPLRPLLQPWREIANSVYLNYLLEQRPRAHAEEVPSALVNEATHKLDNLIHGAISLKGMDVEDWDAVHADFSKRFSAFFQVEWIDQLRPASASQLLEDVSDWMRLQTFPEIWLAGMCWTYLEGLRLALNLNEVHFQALAQEWHIFSILESALWQVHDLTHEPSFIIRQTIFLLKVKGWFRHIQRRSLAIPLREWMDDDLMREFLQVNDFDGRTWLGKEACDQALALLTLEGGLEVLQVYHPGSARAQQRLERLAGTINRLREMVEKSQYDVKHLQELLAQHPS